MLSVVGQTARYTQDYAATGTGKSPQGFFLSKNTSSVFARILAEITLTDTTTYLYCRDCLGELRDDEWLYYLNDAEKLVRQSVDEQGEVVSAWLFDPDGVVLGGPEGPVSHLVCGVYDWSTGLIYRGGRCFDPMLRCAVAKQNERRLYGESTLERGVVKHPPYPDLVTGWGV